MYPHMFGMFYSNPQIDRTVGTCWKTWTSWWKKSYTTSWIEAFLSFLSTWIEAFPQFHLAQPRVASWNPPSHRSVRRAPPHALRSPRPSHPWRPSRSGWAGPLHTVYRRWAKTGWRDWLQNPVPNWPIASIIVWISFDILGYYIQHGVLSPKQMSWQGLDCIRIYTYIHV